MGGIGISELPAPIYVKCQHLIVRLDNGQLLVDMFYDCSVVMLDINNQPIQSITPQDLPELGIKYAAGRHLLLNGNLICTTYNGPYPVFEVTPDKKIVWKIKAGSLLGKPLKVQAIGLSEKAGNFELRK